MPKKLLVVSRKFPPSVGGTQTVLKNLFEPFDPQDYLVVHDGERGNQENPFFYEDVQIDFPQSFRNYLGKFVIPLYVFLIPLIVWKLLRLHSRKKFNKLLIVYPDPFFSVAGYVFSRIVSLDYVLYFHDLFEEAQTKPTRFVQRVLASLFERKMIERSHLFLVISEGLSNFYQDKYDVSPVVLPHSIDLGLFDLRPVPKRGRNRRHPLKIVYTGEVYDNQCDTFLLFVRALRQSGLHYELFITSKMHPDYFRDLGLLDRNTKVKFFPNRVDVFKAQQSAVVLYLPLAFNSPVPYEVKTSLPTKIFEYIASMTPILVHCPGDSFLKEFCSKNEIGTICTSQEKEDVIKALKQAMKDSVDVGHRKRLLREYDRKRVGRRFKTLMGFSKGKDG